MQRAWCLIVIPLLALGACGDKHDALTPRLPQRIDISVDAAGAFTAYAVRGTARDELASGALAGDTASTALAGLRDALQKAIASPELRDDTGYSTLRVHVTTEPQTPWKSVQWLLMSCADPGVRLHLISIRESDEAELVQVDLPRDDALGRTLHTEGPLKVRVKLFRKNKRDPDKAFTRVRVGDRRMGRTIDLPPTAQPDPQQSTRDWIEVTKLIRFEHDPEKTQVGELQAPPPDGGDVPVADAIRVLRIFRDVGYAHLHLDGAPLPTMSGG